MYEMLTLTISWKNAHLLKNMSLRVESSDFYGVGFVVRLSPLLVWCHLDQEVFRAFARFA